MSSSDAAVTVLEPQSDQATTTGEATVGQPTETPKVRKHRIRKAFVATGHGLKAAGTAVIDTDLRDIGQATKRGARRVKEAIPVRVERVHECGNPQCPHAGHEA